MQDLPFGDEAFVDALVAEHEEAHARKTAVKEARIVSGKDPAIEGDEGCTNTAELTLEEREARWGFSHEDLRAATKVVGILFHKPQLYVGDPYLAESRLYTMISRDRKAKRQHRDTYRQIMGEERTRKERKQKQEDIDAMQKTKLKQERDAALNRLLLPPPESDDDDETGPVEAEEDEETPTELRLNRKRKCHICKNPYETLHNYYYSLCPPCGEFNFCKRNQTRDLQGRYVLLTGCRIKIGYEMALSLLRCGAHLIGTTRFAVDAQARFVQEKDYDEWKDRLQLFSLDLRDLWMVTQFCAYISQHVPSLFAIVNNAAQTIARLPEYTSRLRAAESTETSFSDTEGQWRSFFLENSSVAVGVPLKLDCNPSHHVFDGATHSTPEGEAATRALQHAGPLKHDRYDTAYELSDQRTENSWTLNLGHVAGSEATEVMAINALAPFVLNSKLKPLMMKRDGADPNEGRFVINVSVMEGQFYRYKQTTHPHTNMAKAALNMMTRTSAADYAKDHIFMNSVDTGWITDESPAQKKARRGTGFQQCPLDEVDAAARCLDLIYTDSKEHGQFWKDYKPIPW